MAKVFASYHEQKKEQKRLYDRLYSVTEALENKEKTEEFTKGHLGALLATSRRVTVTADQTKPPQA